MKVGIVNYGMGNIASVRRACIELGATVIFVDHPDTLKEVDKLILPGVGGFSEGSQRLRENGWFEAIQQIVLEKNKPLLGICLGMQLLASKSEEGGINTGLNLIPGQVKRLDKIGCSLRIPHVGWNDIHLKNNNPLFSNIPNNTDFYFAHSYALCPDDTTQISACVHYDSEIVAAVANNHVFGVQFHPEKSSKPGRFLLKNFLDYRTC